MKPSIAKSFLLSSLKMRLFSASLMGISVFLGVPADAQTTVSPTTITWAKVAIGQAGGQKTATLTNGGNTAITISGIGLTGTNPKDFSIYKNTCGSTLAASASCTTTLLFRPTTTGTRTATLIFTDSDPSSPQEVSLSGLGTGSVTAAPGALNFGNVTDGSSSASQSITITNSTASSVTFSAPSITGANAADFAFTSGTTCGSTLAASASCFDAITFTPTLASSETATWSITGSNSSTPLTVSLYGTGTTSPSSATVSPASLAWSSVTVGQAGAQKTVTLTNTGSSAITINSIAFTGADPGDFAILNNTCGSTLPASSNCTTTIRFVPVASGTRTANLTFTDSDPSSPQQVALSGVAAAGSTGSVTVAPTSLSFGSVSDGSTSSPQSVTIANTTANSVNLSASALSGTNASDFAVSSTNCGSSLAASTSCSATIAFTPSLQAAESATWTIAFGSSATPLTVSLTGTGTSGGTTGGTTFYVDNCGIIGNDSNSGTSPSNAWLTIAKVNSSTFSPGDSIKFNGGCIWREQLTVPSPGSASNPIIIGSYGSGPAPTISGSQLATAWVTEPQNATNFTTDPNLQAYWTMNQMSGSSFLDSSSNGNTLSNTNGVTQTASQVAGSYAAAFAAASKMSLSRTSATLSPGFLGQSGTANTNATVGGWVYFSSVAPDMSFMLKGTGKSWGLFLGVGSNADKMEWQAYLDSGYRLVASNNAMSPGTWYHVVGRINAATNEQALFINGVKQSHTYSIVNPTLFTDTTPLEIGASSAGTYFLNGDVDDLFVFNRALSDNEIAGIYNSGFEGSLGDYNLYYVTGFGAPGVVYENGVAMSAAPQKEGMSQGSWWWDAADSRVYIRPAGDVNPATETIEIPQQATCITDNQNYTTITGLTCQEAILQGVYVTGSNVTIQNMLVQHIRSNASTTPNQNGYAVGVFWTGSNDTIQNNTVTDTNWGIFSDVSTGKSATSGLVQRNTVYNIGYDGIGFAVATPNGGVLSNTIGQYNVVYNVGIYGMQGGAVECIYGGPTIGNGNVFRYNQIFNNGTPERHSYPLNVQGGAGSCTFYGNIVYNNYGPCVEVATGPGGNAFYNNVCYNNGLAGGEGAGFFLDGGSSNTGNIIENNIVYASATSGFMDITAGSQTGNTFDYNIYFGGNSAPFTWNGTAYSMANYLAASGQDAQSINADPQFNNPSSDDFTLNHASPAIGAGLNLGPPWQFDLQPGSVWPNAVTTASQSASGGWDIGAYVNN